MSSNFPYRVDLEQRIERVDAISAPRGFWFSYSPIHKEVVGWLKEYVGERRVDWFCHEAGFYLLKREEDAVALKLRWL